MRIPQSIADVDQPWINAALRDQPTFPDQKISTFSYQVVGQGTGFMGEVIILTLTYQSEATHRPCLLYTSPSPRDGLLSRMPSSA